jgi:hypothetical protein
MDRIALSAKDPLDYDEWQGKILRRIPSLP